MVRAQYQAFSATVIGSSHVKHGKECQDYSLHYSGGKPESLAGAVLAVAADGHGADECFRSGTGAKIAAQCAGKGIAEFIGYLGEKPGFLQKPLAETLSPGEFTGELRQRLIQNGFIRAWHRAVEDDYERNPFTPAELEAAGEKYRPRYEKGKGVHKAYGATLIACALTPAYWFGIHIGDGRLTALYEDGSFDQPVPWDEKCFLNQTTSICDDDAAERARVYVSFHAAKAPPLAVFLCSDGVDDNYPVEENEKYLFKLYRTIALTFAEDGFESTCEQIKGLANSFATKGKGDDTSIAGIVDMEAIERAVPIWKAQIAAEEAEAARINAARKEAEAARENAAPETPDTATAQAARAYDKTMNGAESGVTSYGDSPPSTGINNKKENGQ